MKKNRFLALALSLLMALALPLGAFAEENEPDTLLEGLVTEVLEQGFVMEDIELGSVLLNVDETTVMDGILAEGDIEVGQYVFVEYDGRLTRSLPPQAHADRVGCYRLTGTVDLSLSMGVLLTGDPTFGDVIIRVDGSMPHLYQGMPITVYYNGVMAMSYPGQVTARHIVVPELTGVVSDRDSAGFTLTDAEGNEYRVLLSEQTFTGVLSASLEDAPVVEDAVQEDAAEAETAENAEATADDEPAAETPADEPRRSLKRRLPPQRNRLIANPPQTSPSWRNPSRMSPPAMPRMLPRPLPCPPWNGATAIPSPCTITAL